CAQHSILLAFSTDYGTTHPAIIIVQLVLTLYYRARAGLPCFEVYLATLPPRDGLDPRTVRHANATIRAGMEARGAVGRIVPFDEQTTDDLGADGVHMDAAGQEHRAALAFAALGW